MIESSPSGVHRPIEIAALLWALSAWTSGPAVLKVIASLLTAIAAFFRFRRHYVHDTSRQGEPLAKESSLFHAYKALHEVEERIRQELLIQLQNMREKANAIGQDLTTSQNAVTALKDTLMQCQQADCPTRQSFRQEP